MFSSSPRPWPKPNHPWALAMEWTDLLFIHWPVDPLALRPLIPPGLEIDTFGGQAWIGVVPFRMSGVRPRLAPALPWLSTFLELNVRTYVTTGDKPGVWFFSLDAANPVAVSLARRFFHLPYFNARMEMAADIGWIKYKSVRTERGEPGAFFQARYRPEGPAAPASPGSLEEWLTARYCLYAARGKNVYRGEIHHPPWPLQPATLEIQHNSTLEFLGPAVNRDQKPHLLFARSLPVVAWTLERLGPP